MLLDEFPTSFPNYFRQEEIFKPPFRSRLVVQLSTWTVPSDWQRYGSGTRPTIQLEVSRHSIRQDVVLFGSFFRDERLHCLAKQGVVTPGSRAHKVEK